MATIVLQAAGAAIGGAVGGPFGAMIGRAAGAIAGNAIDQKLFSKDQIIKGRRLEASRMLTAQEGVPIPKLYGRMRVGGQVIWATRFEEVKKVKKSGGKGGPSVRTEKYKYFANFAVGICEGPISHIGRIWADGTEIDRTKFEIRIHTGTDDQLPDPLIEAKQGQGSTPAYRGTAYAVFERMPLADFGNRIPNLTFEVIRSVATLDRLVRSVTVIPAAGEFSYHPDEIVSKHRGKSRTENRHTLVAASDWTASMDELQALCPNLESVSLVIAWFGTDLRASHCRIEPRITHRDLKRAKWTVSGIDRGDANEVSRIGGLPAYGGTPSDATILAAIRDLTERGLKVTFYPFIMMDIPDGNGLPDPYGGNEQAVHPWRGRITCDPAPGKTATPDRTSTAQDQLETLVGQAAPAHFAPADDTVTYSGPAEWSLRRMILHYAHLCQLAGGVDRFLIGSEFRGLTQIRGAGDTFPFVEGMIALATDVREIVGQNTEISYAADWSEYWGYQPQNEAGTRYFHLDSLWADPNINAVAIDNYMPLADWQPGGDPGLPQQGSGKAVSYLQSNIVGGEGYDWYYASEEDRTAARRTPITDGDDEPWIWRYKDIPSWWLNRHHERRGGVRVSEPTAWVPGMKPVWFSELGCPAVDRGANQPNVFIDAKSSESALPYCSRGGRDDLIQSRFLEAHLEFWAAGTGMEVSSTNPVSPVNGGRMISTRDVSLWTWDARPFPVFPLATEVWSDGENWHRGHWLNGRIGSCPLDDLLKAIFADFGLEPPRTEVDGHIEGFMIAGGEPPRLSLEPLLGVHNAMLPESSGTLEVLGKDHTFTHQLVPERLVRDDEVPDIKHQRDDENELPVLATLEHADVFAEFDMATARSNRLETASARQVSMQVPAAIGRPRAAALTNARLRDLWVARDRVQFAIGSDHLAIEAGDSVSIAGGPEFRVERITGGFSRRVEAVAVNRFEELAPWLLPARGFAGLPVPEGEPLVLLMNLPLGQNAFEPQTKLTAAIAASPWRDGYAIWQASGEVGFKPVGSVASPAVIAQLKAPLLPGPLGRWDEANSLLLESPYGNFESLPAEQILAGDNAIAVECATGGYEILQFRSAELLTDGNWRLNGLLRGQMGTDFEMKSGAETGANAVLLDDDLVSIPVPSDQIRLVQQYRISPAGESASFPGHAALAATCTAISARPLSPVHLRHWRDPAGDDHFTWVRRSRLSADSWELSEIPLDEPEERYEIRIYSDAGELRRQLHSGEPSLLYEAAYRSDDLPVNSMRYHIEIAQVSRTGELGPALTAAIAV